MIASMQGPSDAETMQKFSLEEKILKLHSELVEAAKQAGITLSSH